MIFGKDNSNVLFQLAHVLGLIELRDLLNKLTAGSKINAGTSLARCHVELANYFAAAFLMPYEPFLREAESMAYDIDRLAARFGVLIRTGLSPVDDAAAARRAGCALLLPARR